MACESGRLLIEYLRVNLADQSPFASVSSAQSTGSGPGAGGRTTQSTTLCAGATYTLSFYSGLYDFSAAPNKANGCTVTAAFDSNVVSTKKVCDAASATCTLNSPQNNGYNLPYRMDTVTYTPTTSGTVPLSFLIACSVPENLYTTVDTVSLVRTA